MPKPFFAIKAEKREICRIAPRKELLALGNRDYREIFFKAYRIIHKVMNGKVYILLIADGRRDVRTHLQRRLLQA